MNDPAKHYLEQLAEEIGDHPDKQEILADYQMHIEDLLEDSNIPRDKEYEELVLRLGEPKDLARVWKKTTSITPRKTQWLFVFCNIFIFVMGIALTVLYNIFEWDWIEQLWTALTDMPTIIILLYVMFWGLLGYEIGKEFGNHGLSLLRKTFWLSIVPNLLLMYLVVFKLIPHEWFEPLLSAPFIVVCIVFTILLYPITWLGYRWGRRDSV
ncbi:hypothetical protein D8M04_17275 [Oceanobacillus piezotolerans]|uniref:DUF1700 domain-containing protein n=1 Tax=Oceanobacillus piezotolerans TaxID=2448030 RepID=A0A498DDX2_9BACI|nr:hypothetical protein [Oceanobacillus piezotolerans]RLL41275.1 hypothetical protein D8M04_17275 [Oceanobacillus piezotolerans]